MTTPARIFSAVCAAVGLFVAGYMANRHQGPAASSRSARKVVYYACPMHPQYRSDRPGNAPCCGMPLEPVYAGDQVAADDTANPPGIIRISAARQQLIGVRTQEVQLAPVSHRLRTPGRVAVDEGRAFRLIAAGDGWIRELRRNPAGTLVKKDQVLASFYTPNLLVAQQTLLFAPTSGPQVRGAGTAFNTQVAVDTLRSMGMNDIQIEEVQRTHQSASEVNIYSPVTGVVLARNISPGQRFDKGSELYRIADLGHVWVMADIFEKDRDFIRPGTLATIQYQAKEYDARLSNDLPQFDPQTRTLKTRFELDNPGNVLRPDMFVDVEIRAKMDAALTVVSDAIIDSGLRKTVFVDRGNGIFEPRQVETGWRLGDRVQILSGLEPGERVVVSGSFLIDSESRMKLASLNAGPVATITAIEKDPVCGMDVDPKAPNALASAHGGTIYHFCSSQCKRDFDANPAKYVTRHSLARNSERGPA